MKLTYLTLQSNFLMQEQNQRSSYAKDYFATTQKDLASKSLHKKLQSMLHKQTTPPDTLTHQRIAIAWHANQRIKITDNNLYFQEI